MKLKRLILVLIASAIAVFSGIVFFAEPDTDEIIDDYEDITQPDDDKTDNGKTPSDDKETPDKTDKPAVTKKSVKPEITSWGVSSGQLSVRGVVTSIIEAGASCKFTLRNSDGEAVDTATSVSVANSSSTSCPAVELSLDSSLGGNYKVVLRYSSVKYSGESEPLTVEN